MHLKSRNNPKQEGFFMKKKTASVVAVAALSALMATSALAA